jgi:hypothetical protein
MQRIDVPPCAPERARKPQIWFDDGVTPTQYQCVQQARSALLDAHHRAVEDYIAECALDEEDMFPYRGALTGEYYLEATERYGLIDRTVSVSIMARCLGISPPHSSNPPDDYLGIDIVLLFNEADATFSAFYNGSSVI